MYSTQVFSYDTDTLSSSVFKETRRFLWWHWTTYRWVSYHYDEGKLHPFKVLRGRTADLTQAIVAAKMEVHR